jgi:hypothetical protein
MAGIQSEGGFYLWIRLYRGTTALRVGNQLVRSALSKACIGNCPSRSPQLWRARSTLVLVSPEARPERRYDLQACCTEFKNEGHTVFSLKTTKPSMCIPAHRNFHRISLGMSSTTAGT